MAFRQRSAELERKLVFTLLTQLHKTWFSHPKADILAGITVALALIPEAIAFSLIAGVNPMVGLHASFCIAIIIAFVGGRPAMISAATGAMALLMATLVKNYGLEYLYAATILTGLIQFGLGAMKLGRFITFIPHSVVTGFVNALAILIFAAQLVHFNNQSWIMYALVAATLVIIYVLPRFTKAVPSALVAIIAISILSIAAGFDVKTVGDMGQITRELPLFHLPAIPLTWETLMIVLPYSFPLALVGILESLLTATILDEMTETKSNKNREMRGQGIANAITGCFGGMAGCAMIGQSVINVKSGGRGRLSTLVAGAFLLFLIMVLGDIVTAIPMAALVGVMFMVSISTFDWKSLTHMRTIPASDSVIMIATVIVVVLTEDLSKGVMVGVAMAALSFGWKMARLHAHKDDAHAGKRTYTIHGQLFFGTATHFIDLFEVDSDPAVVEIDFSHSHIWDHSALTAIGKVLDKYQAQGKAATISGLNTESIKMLEKSGLPIG